MGIRGLNTLIKKICPECVITRDISYYSGKTFIIDPRVNANVTVVSNEDLSIDEAYEVFLSVLSVHGFSAVEQDCNGS